MSDIVQDLTTSEDVKIDGKPYTFKFLNTYDKAEFIAEYRKQYKAKTTENRKAAGVDAMQLVADLDELDDNPPDKWAEWLQQSDDAKLFACRLSLKKTYPKEADDLARRIDLDDGEFFKLVLKLFGRFVFLRPNAPAAPPADSTSTYGDGGSPPNAGTPETYAPADSIGTTSA